jgi:hypothetical protein
LRCSSLTSHCREKKGEMQPGNDSVKNVNTVEAIDCDHCLCYHSVNIINFLKTVAKTLLVTATYINNILILLKI